MITAFDELIQRCKQDSPMLKRFHRFHQTNPQVFDFLISEMRVDRENGWKRTSVGSLYHYARWVLTRKYRAPGETFVMDQRFESFYARVIAILHPDLNGFFEMKRSPVDAIFGTVLEPVAKSQRGYIRRLLWADGTPIERGWRPNAQHEPQPVRRRERVRRMA